MVYPVHTSVHVQNPFAVGIVTIGAIVWASTIVNPELTKLLNGPLVTDNSVITPPTFWKAFIELYFSSVIPSIGIPTLKG